MTLGELIARLDDPAVAVEVLMATGDLALITSARETAQRRSLSLGDFLSETVGLFASSASSDDWMAAMTAASRSENPGGAFMRAVLERSGRRGPDAGAGANHGHG
ncbi:MAG: hypothetical protein KDJ36_11995 [Hyphomicrobiaceae bacterium]|nr:hypothetical protein [Hyphomicrobiaceae bacterium]